MTIEQMLLEAIRQGGAIALAMVIWYYSRQDANKRVAEADVKVGQEREDKKLLMDALDRNTQALTRLSTLMETWIGGEREQGQQARRGAKVA